MIFRLILFFTILSSLHATEKVSVQLLWLHQFEFAGFYMAKEKGFYGEAGLDVELKPYKNGLNIVDEVINKRATYGLGYSSLLIDASQDKKIKLLASIMQSSPLIFLTTKESNITEIADFKGRRVMMIPGSDSNVALNGMMNRYGIHKNEIILQEHSFHIDDLIDHKTDILTAYESNEPFLLKEKGVDYTIIDPKKYGFDFYNNILFTSENEVIHHSSRTANFTEASLRGWKYAFEHIDETVNLILLKYNTQNKSREALLFEANALKHLAYSGNKELGDIKAEKLQRIYDIFNISGFIKNPLDVKKMIFKKSTSLILTKEERNYLTEKKDLKLCIQPDLFPIDGIKDGHQTGISGDIYAIISKKLGVSFVPVVSKDKDELFKNIQEKRCDLLSLTSTEQRIFPAITLTQPFVSTSMTLVSKVDKLFIENIASLEGKKIFVRHIQFKNYLLQFNPRLTIEVANSLDSIANKVLNDEGYCVAIPNESAEWMIQKYGIGKLKVNGFIGKEKPNLMGIGVINDKDILLPLLNKTLQSIPEETLEQIKLSWTLKSYSKETNYAPFWGMMLFFLTIFIGFLYRQRILHRINISLEDNVTKRTSELQNSNNLLETIFNSTKECIGIIDKDTTFIFANKAYFEMLGYSEVLLYQKSCLGLTVTEDIEIARKALHSVLEKGYANNIEKRCIRYDGTVIATRMSVIVMPDSDNFLIITSDITEENRLKNEQIEYEHQMLQQSRLAQMGEMIAMIAHQWRQPLSSIAATALNMKLKLELESFDLEIQEGRDALNRFFIEKLANIEHYVDNLTTTIDDFRNFYKPNKKMVHTSYKEVATRALKIIRTSIETDNIEIIEEYGDESQFEIYDNEMMQVILNLFKNSQDNFKEKNIENPKIWVTSQNDNLFICDNGGGIPEEIIDKVFDPYFSTKNEKNGTGLGLYMSKVIIEEHHKGKLRVRNQNGGVSFRIILEKQNG